MSYKEVCIECDMLIIHLLMEWENRKAALFELPATGLYRKQYLRTGTSGLFLNRVCGSRVTGIISSSFDRLCFDGFRALYGRGAGQFFSYACGNCKPINQVNVASEKKGEYICLFQSGSRKSPWGSSDLQVLMLMICTGQRSDASCAQASRSSVGVPSAIFPLIRYFSMIRLNESTGSCSNNPGQASQHVPQLTQVARSIVTFIPYSIL